MNISAIIRAILATALLGVVVLIATGLVGRIGSSAGSAVKAAV